MRKDYEKRNEKSERKSNSGLKYYWGNLHEIRYFCLANLCIVRNNSRRRFGIIKSIIESEQPTFLLHFFIMCYI